MRRINVNRPNPSVIYSGGRRYSIVNCPVPYVQLISASYVIPLRRDAMPQCKIRPIPKAVSYRTLCITRYIIIAIRVWPSGYSAIKMINPGPVKPARHRVHRIIVIMFVYTIQYVCGNGALVLRPPPPFPEGTSHPTVGRGCEGVCRTCAAIFEDPSH